MVSHLDELAFRESVFAWLRSQQLTKQEFTREDLSRFEFNGKTFRLVGPQTGIWKPKDVLDGAISILTSFSPDESARPYDDSVGADGLLRYKYRGTNPQQADNVWLRIAMQRELPLVWFNGIGFVAGTRTQVFMPIYPVWIVGEEPQTHQFVVAVEQSQKVLPVNAPAEIVEIAKRYNDRVVRTRHHQPIFRRQVIHAYERRCAVCRLPFEELLDAAHIKPDSDGGIAHVRNGLALCKIHHGAFDTNIMGISPDYVVAIRESVLQTFDGPTLQHSLKEMNGQKLAQLPTDAHQKPDRELLEQRFQLFQQAS